MIHVVDLFTSIEFIDVQKKNDYQLDKILQRIKSLVREKRESESESKEHQQLGIELSENTGQKGCKKRLPIYLKWRYCSRYNTMANSFQIPK